MVSRERFCGVLNSLKGYVSRDDEACAQANMIYGGSHLAEFISEVTGPYIELVVDSIACAVDDYSNWTYWWVFDDEFGKNRYEVEINDEKVTIDSPELLYDMITGTLG